jgi:hypothetical protein
MIYRSNLSPPQLNGNNFRMVSKPRLWSLGHDVPSDPLLDPECCFMTHDEVAIVHAWAARLPGEWVDIGCRLMWTAVHIAQTMAFVLAVDPALAHSAFRRRALDNLSGCDASELIHLFPLTAQEFFSGPAQIYRCISGVVIDGNHDQPEPLNDARGALANLAPTGAVLFHDFWGRPIREGVEHLIEAGMKCRVYNTPNGMAVCWRGAVDAVHHVPDPAIDWERLRQTRAPEFDFARWCA